MTDKNPPERAHARFGPSSYKYRELCPHWENDNSPDKSTHAADMGTRLHLALETGDLSPLNGDPEEIALVTMCREYLSKVVGEWSK